AGSVFAQEAQVEASLYDFTLKDLDGKEVRLAEFKGKQPVVLFFWTTWCPYCLRELRYLNSIYQNFISDDIVVLSINVQESKAKVKKFISKNPTLLKVLLDSDGVVAYSYRLIGVPTFILINKKGEIVFKDHYFPIETYQRLLSDQ
ncbi:MAG: TlpA family protein disulfide reductase, partial [Candidatus Omnitrophica bacterium]|nr:TlpA family protein disulfide reductase [Candidatus Omnitrophota bacterium]